MTEITSAGSTGRIDMEGEERFVFSARTNVGLLRDHNEDSLVALPPLFAVCDGMGGHEAGEVASKIAVETLAREAPEDGDGEALCRAVCSANLAVIEGAENGDGRPGMGTTCTAAIIDGRRLLIAHVGDSRSYLLRDGKITQLTQDHSLVADLMRQGRITAEEARIHPQRSVITRALGSAPDMVPDLYEVILQPYDRLLINSDGLSSMIPDEDIERIMDACVTTEECADALVDAALSAGGHDNVTVIVVDIPAPIDASTDKQDQDTRELEPVAVQVVTPVSSASPDPSPAIAAAEAALADAYDAQRGVTGEAPAKVAETAEAVSAAVSDVISDKPVKNRKPVIGFIIALAVIIACAIGGVYSYAHHVAYLIEENGTITVYQGFPDDIAGVSLRWHVKDTDIKVAELPQPTAERLKAGVKVGSLDEADALLTDYRHQISEAQVANSDFSAPNPTPEESVSDLVDEAAEASQDTEEAAESEEDAETEEAGE